MRKHMLDVTIFDNLLFDYTLFLNCALFAEDPDTELIVNIHALLKENW